MRGGFVGKPSSCLRQRNATDGCGGPYRDTAVCACRHFSSSCAWQRDWSGQSGRSSQRSVEARTAGELTQTYSFFTSIVPSLSRRSRNHIRLGSAVLLAVAYRLESFSWVCFERPCSSSVSIVAAVSYHRRALSCSGPPTHPDRARSGSPRGRARCSRASRRARAPLSVAQTRG